MTKPANPSLPQRKLLIIGVDAGSPELFRKWSESGDLPNIRRLMAAGETRHVKNPYGLEAGTVWPVFHSGLMPGTQPQYDARRVFVPEDYSVRWYGAEETPPTVWRELSDQGLRCLLIDPPYTHLDSGINGAMIVDWGGHVPANGQRFDFRTHPPELADEVLSLVGEDPAGGTMCDRRYPESVEDHKRFRDTYLKRIELKGRLAAHMLRNRDWDLSLIVSCDLHCTGHHLWHVNDPGHPRYSPKLEAALGEPLRDCYRAFDRSLGEILAAAGPETTVILFGSHGMGPSYSGTGLLDRILLRLDRGGPEKARGSVRSRVKSRVRRAWKSLPLELRGRLRGLRKPLKGSLRPQQLMGGSGDRRFFEVYANNASGGIRLNVKGREGQGVVEPGQADALMDFLIDEIRKVKNVDSGEPLVDDIFKTKERYSGTYLDRMPDLLVRWNRNAPILKVRSDSIGELLHEFHDNRSGDHTPGGICVIAGAGVEAGRRGAAIQPADFGPAVAEFFGLRLHRTDGRGFTIVRSTEAA